MKRKNLQKKNRRTLRIFDNCDDLPAWRFFKVFETDDKRYLLDCNTLPEYNDEFLIDIWDKIIIQYDKLTGDHYFENLNAEILSDLEEWNELIILKACYNLMQIGREDALPILKSEFGIDFKKITIDAMQQLRSKIMKIQTKFEIERACKDENTSNSSGYIRSIVQLSNIFGKLGIVKIIDQKTITVSEYVCLNKEVKELIRINQPKTAWDK